VRSEADTGPEDPSLAACWAANCFSIRVMVVCTSGKTNPRLMKVSWCYGEDRRKMNLHSVRASGFVNVDSDSRSSIVRAVS